MQIRINPRPCLCLPEINMQNFENKYSGLEKIDTQFMFRLPVRELTGIRLTSLKFQTHYAKTPRLIYLWEFYLR
jgi:hypothetical protein